MAVTKCRHFDGNKPCHKHPSCDGNCPFKSIPSVHVLFIHLEALGAVLRSTSLLAGIRRKYPNCHLTWLTKPGANKLIENNPLIDKVITLSAEGLMELQAKKYDIALCVDKAKAAAGVMHWLEPEMSFGFTSDKESSAIVPANESAQYLWELGLNNEKKFFENKKTEQQVVSEALEIPYKKDEYILDLTEDEKLAVQRRKEEWTSSGQPIVIGINTGCSSVLAYKKLSVEGHRKLIKKLQKSIASCQIVLLGGKEDSARNQQIGEDLNVIQSPTEQGLRDGMVSTAACDIVITGDSLGMHMAIALKRWVVAWFGPTCAHEIELYSRGQKILSSAECGPCWKRSCHKDPMCYDLVPFDDIVNAVKSGILWKIESSLREPPAPSYSNHHI
jgi:heptosyltransferase-2